MEDWMRCGFKVEQGYVLQGLDRVVSGRVG